jgi:hypothetical protein
MRKLTIDAQQATADIRSGMQEHTLMAKYRLTAKGLQSLQTKLVQAGMLEPHEIEYRESDGVNKTGKISPKVSAKQILSDLKSGMRDHDLIQKYHISAREVQALYDRFINAGLISATEIYKSTSHLESTVDIDADAILDEMHATGTNWDEDHEIPPVPDSDIVDSDDSPPSMATHIMESCESPLPPDQPTVTSVAKKPDEPLKDRADKSFDIPPFSTAAPEPKPPIADLKAALKVPASDSAPKQKSLATTLIFEPISETADSKPEETSPAAEMQPEPKPKATDIASKEKTKPVEQEQIIEEPYVEAKPRSSFVVIGLRWFGVIQLALGIIWTIMGLILPDIFTVGSGFGQLKIAALPMLISCGIFLLFWTVAEGLEMRRALTEVLDNNNKMLKRLLNSSKKAPKGR